MFVLHEAPFVSHLNRLSPQNEEVLCSHHHKPHKFMAQDLLDLIRLRKSLNGQNKLKQPLTLNLQL